tara:strand:- start:3 stop:866 length:864 start_codon:yes stop_codon:yes gene_type:complete
VKKFKIKSFCKINLTLRVIKRLKNDYHKIQSLVTFCNIHDDILITKIHSPNDKIFFSGKFNKGINNKNNTITKLLYLLRKIKVFKNQYFKINIKKNIPHGSGLGGGSSNAATLLKFFNSNMNLRFNKNQLRKIANKIGQDTTISLFKKNTLISGEEKKIIRFDYKLRLNVLIVYPNVICSTKKIYKKNKEFSSQSSLKNFTLKSRKKLINFLKNENNDLQITTIKYYPKVGKIINIIQSQNGCDFSRITGSGSACIGIFNTKKNAIYAQKLIKLKYPKYWSVVSKTI